MSGYQHWYYINKNYEEDGPVSSDDLNRMAKAGDIHRGTYVWTQELDEWVPASKVGGLFKDDKPKNVVKQLTEAEAPTSKKTGGILSRSKPAPEPKPATPVTGTAILKPLHGSAGAPHAAPTPITGAAPLRQPQPSSPAQQPAAQQHKGPVPMTAPQSIVAKPLTGAQPLRPIPGATAPTPITAPQSIIPKPLTAANPIPGKIPSSAPTLAKPHTAAHKIPAPPAGASTIPTPQRQRTALPKAMPLSKTEAQATSSIQQNSAHLAPVRAAGGSAAGANSIPAPINMASNPGQPGQPPMPAPPGAPIPLTGHTGALPSIPPVGRSIAPFNQTPTSALQQADEDSKQRKAPRPMSLD